MTPEQNIQHTQKRRPFQRIDNLQYSINTSSDTLKQSERKSPLNSTSSSTSSLSHFSYSDEHILNRRSRHYNTAIANKTKKNYAKPQFDFQEFHYRTGRFRSPKNANLSAIPSPTMNSTFFPSPKASPTTSTIYTHTDDINMSQYEKSNHTSNISNQQTNNSISYASICTHALVHNHEVIGLVDDAHLSSLPNISADATFPTTTVQSRQDDDSYHLSESSFATPNCSQQSPLSSVLQTQSLSGGFQWKTSFAPHSVMRITSTPDGNIIAISTTGGYVSLLNGRDGAILATRQIAGQETFFLPTEVQFVSKVKRPNKDEGSNDALIIFTPSFPFQYQSNSSTGSIAPISPSLQNHKNSDPLLVTGINGGDLASSHSSVVTSAAQNLTVNALQFELTSDSGSDRSIVYGANKILVAAINGLFLKNGRLIRFMICDTKGQLHVHDYDIKLNNATAIESFLPITREAQIDSTQIEWKCLPQLGIKIDTHCNVSPFFVVSACNELIGRSKICWYDVNTLDLLCEYDVTSTPTPIPMPLVHDKITNNNDPPVLLGVEPVSTCSSGSSVAISIALKPKSSEIDVVLHIVQLLVKACTPSSDFSNGDFQKCYILNPHLLYNISHKPVGSQDFLQQINLVSIRNEPYSFKYTVVNDSSSQECKVFMLSSILSQVGSYRLLLAMNRFEQADSLLVNLEKENDNNEIEPLSKFIHSSETALWNLRFLLEKYGMKFDTKDTAALAKDCLRRLGHGAVTGGDIGIQYLLHSARLISSWTWRSNFDKFEHSRDNPEENKDDADRSDSIHTVRVNEFKNALIGMKTAMSNVLNAIPSMYTKVVENEMTKLADRISVLEVIEEVLIFQSDHKKLVPDLYLNAPISLAASIEDLYRRLITDGFLTVSERIRQLSRKSTISNEFAASCVEKIPLFINPKSYSEWLSDIVSRLSLHHPVFHRIKIWVCRAADEFDSNQELFGEDGLSMSIILLKTFCHASSNLESKKMMSVSKITSLQDLKADINTTLEPFSSARSFSSPMTSELSDIAATPCSNDQNKNQNMKMTHNGASKIEKNTSTIGKNFLSISIPVDSILSQDSLTTGSPPETGVMFAEDGFDDCKLKLRHAEILLQARSLGLPTDMVHLNDYDKNGAEIFLAQKLIAHLLLTKSSGAEKSLEIETIVMRVGSFCEKTSLNFDDIIHQYTEEYCISGKRICANTLIHISSLVKYCSNLAKKCEIALQVLQAGLLCSEIPTHLTELSRESITWANQLSQHKVKAELEEATRLLKIDSIVRRYCGNAAHDFFRVSDPRHAFRLIEHVCKFVDDPKSFTDALLLCDSYVHISKIDVCALFLENVILASDVNALKTETIKEGINSFPTRANQTASLLTNLYQIDEHLASEVGSRVIAFCSQILEDNRCKVHKEYEMKCIRVCSSACSILQIMSNNENTKCSRNSFSEDFSKKGVCKWSSLKRQFERIYELQTSFSIFLNLHCLRKCDVQKASVSKLLFPAEQLLLLKNDIENEKFYKNLKKCLIKAKRGCALIFDVCNESAWFEAVASSACKMADSSKDSLCFDLLSASGMLDPYSGELASKALLNVTKALCHRSSKDTSDFTNTPRCKDLYELNSSTLPNVMRNILRASSLLQDNAKSCPDKFLPSIAALSSIIDLVTQVLTRADGYVGENTVKYFNRIKIETRARQEAYIGQDSKNEYYELEISTPSQTKLHPNFYVGDGLLLPPMEALCYCMDHCIDQMRFFEIPNYSFKETSDTMSFNHLLSGDLFSFLSEKGAWSISLSILIQKITFMASNHLKSPDQLNDSVLLYFMQLYDKSIQSCAERCLGGSNQGLISGKIDSQLAVSLLLSLPMRQAFKIFRAALPSPINKRDFVRVVKLSNIGIKTHNEGVEGRGSTSWKNQIQFVTQCRSLSLSASWWSLLKYYDVSFDPRGFGEDLSTNSRGMNESSVEYAESLVPMLINGSSKKLQDPEEILQLAINFGNAFSIDPNCAAQKVIEFMLSPLLNQESIQISPDGHNDYYQDDENFLCAVKAALNLLPSSMARSAVLRRCIISFENASCCQSDYERQLLILSIYHQEITKVKGEHKQMKQSHISTFNEEIKRIENRQNVLFVLKSIFPDKRNRPFYNSFFIPFPNPFGSDRSKPKPLFCGVLGPRGKNVVSSEFDPLLGLEPFFLQNSDSSHIAALAPLCHSLGIPSGYIHARSLCVRFEQFEKDDSSLPSFDCSILPVMNRLQKADDGAELAEWCAKLYDRGSYERLKCLHHALTLAMQASCEAEGARLSISESNNGVQLVQKENQALERVKRIESEYSNLHDKIKVQERLSVATSSCTYREKKIIETILQKAVLVEIIEDDISPEKLMQRLLIEASLEVATASLDENDSLSFSGFFNIASQVCIVCNELSERYSHVNLDECVDLLARRWLVHGDESLHIIHRLEKDLMKNHDDISSSFDVNSSRRFQHPTSKSEASRNFSFSKEENTMDFVLDLNSTSDGGLFDDVSSNNGLKLVEQVFLREEAHPLKSSSSVRESSDNINARASLRIAFVLTIKNHPSVSSIGRAENEEKSEKLSISKSAPFLSNIKSTSSPHLGATKYNDFENDMMLAGQAKELLDMVFAKPEKSTIRIVSANSFGTKSSFHSSSSKKKNESLTFAMRHRALSCLMFLIPQQNLVDMIKRGNYIDATHVRTSLTLQNISFSLFLAMEVEAMGLELPHSDLIQLSTMNFTSFARTLWRQHGKNNRQNFKGRLLQLLLELCLHKNQVGDGPLIIFILEELINNDLTRTLLNACELVASLDKSNIMILLSVGDGKGEAVISKVISSVTQKFMYEMKEGDNLDLNDSEVCTIIIRLKKIIEDIGIMVLGQKCQNQFIDKLCKLVTTKTSINKMIGGNILDIAADVACHLKEGETRQNAFSHILDVNGGYDILQQKCEYDSFKISNFAETTSDLMTSIENSLKSDILKSIDLMKTKSMTNID